MKFRTITDAIVVSLLLPDGAASAATTVKEESDELASQNLRRQLPPACGCKGPGGAPDGKCDGWETAECCPEDCSSGPPPPPTPSPAPPPPTPTPAPPPPTPTPAPGAYNIYYGYLHAHTKLSDGWISPEQLFQKGKDAGLDFLGVSDHDSWKNDMRNADWDRLDTAANDANVDGVFVTFRGFEWTSDQSRRNLQNLWMDHGHFTVTGTPGWCNANTHECNHITEFQTWLDAQATGIAIFCHPGKYGTTFLDFDFPYTDKIVGMELWNRNDNFYQNDGYDPSDGVGYYDEALRKGWHIAASGGQDNHGEQIGTMNDYRMAVLATQLTRPAIMDALKNRRFYSVRDKNLALTVKFGANNHPMGSILNVTDFSGGSHDLTFEVSGTNGSFDYIDLVKNGDVVMTWDPASNPFQGTYTIDTNALDSGDYFYVRVSKGSNNADDVKSKWVGIGGTIFFV